jgi:hypothetical protein
MRHYLRQGRIGLLLVTAVFLLSGCGVKTADEYRHAVRVSCFLFSTVDSFEVERPFADVTTMLKKKTKECLDVTVRLICTNCIGGGESKHIFRPTFIANPDRTEVHLQLKRTEVIAIGAPPEGAYVIVLDAAPVDKKRTKIDIYRQSPDEKFIHNAMRGWVKGDNMGCPDLTTH